MIQTTTSGQPKSSIMSHAGSASQLSSTCQHLLPKRIAGGLNHRLGAPSLHYWGMSLTLEAPCRREVFRHYGGPRKVPGSRNVEPNTDIDR
jgi:hypothetical protein